MVADRAFTPPQKPIGKLREVSLRKGLNAIFYRADQGIKWRNLPCDFPAWQTVYGYFRLWVNLGIWEQINGVLVQQVRISEGREPEPRSPLAVGWVDNRNPSIAFL